MSTRRWMDRICVAALILALLLTAVMMNGESLGLQEASRTMGYESRLFDTSRVHTIHIVMDDWDDFIAECENEEYAPCSVVIDGESYTNVGLRAKGNTSLSSVSSMGSDRYSFKMEFDQYDSTKSYYGLDKLSLNNLIQDTTMMKDYLTYRMMDEFGVAAPLCSYVYITVNGEDWGLYLAVEAVEDAFLRRNYGANYGDLYKPDSLSMGGGRGNGREFDMGEFDFSQFSADFDASAADEKPAGQSEAKWNRGEQSGGSDGSGGSGSRPSMDGNAAGGMFNMGDMGGSGGSGGSGSRPSMDGNAAGGVFNMGDMGGFGGFGMGSSDVKLQYIDDDPDSYPNIFSSAKTEVTAADQNRLIAALKTLSGGTDVERAVAVEDVMRYFVVHNYVVNGDSYTGNMIHNYYLYEENGQLSMIPWDYNLAFGTFMGGNGSSSVNEDIDEVLSDRPMQAWIFSDETYRQQYYELYAQLLEQVDVQAIIDHAYQLIAPYVEKDPSVFCSYEEFLTGVETLKEFCALRSESVALQLSGSTETVDAGTLNVSAMGSMGGGMGGFGGRGDRNNSDTEDVSESETTDRQETMQMPGGMQWPGDMQMPDGLQMPDGMQWPADDTRFSPGMNGGVSGGINPNAVLQLAVSAVVLAAGLLFAWKYKRR